MKKARLQMGLAMEATQTEITIDLGEKIPFYFVVICTGSAYVGPKSKQERMIEYQKGNMTLAEARSLLIIGGGRVGVELAGEIITDFPHKVIIVTSSSRLLEFLGQKVYDKSFKWLEKKKIEVIYYDNVDPSAKDGNIYTTRSKKKIEAKLHFWGVGKRLGNAWLQNNEFKNWLNDSGHLKVDSTMRLVDIPNVFCAGDMTDIPEIKQGFLASKQAGVIAENIKKLIKDPLCKRITSYKRLENPFGIVTLGQHVVVAQFSCCTCMGCFPALLKNKDLFVGDSRKNLGLQG